MLLWCGAFQRGHSVAPRDMSPTPSVVLLFYYKCDCAHVHRPASTCQSLVFKVERVDCTYHTQMRPELPKRSTAEHGRA